MPGLNHFLSVYTPSFDKKLGDSQDFFPQKVPFEQQGLIEMLSDHFDYFKSKPVNIPKITILVDNGYHPKKTRGAVEKSLSSNHEQD